MSVQEAHDVRELPRIGQKHVANIVDDFEHWKEAETCSPFEIREKQKLLRMYAETIAVLSAISEGRVTTADSETEIVVKREELESLERAAHLGAMRTDAGITGDWIRERLLPTLNRWLAAAPSTTENPK